MLAADDVDVSRNNHHQTMKKFLFLVLLVGCTQIQQITNSLSSLQKLQFKLNGVTQMKLAGVDITRISSPSSLSIADGLALTQAFARKTLPTSFTLNVDAKNPNTGTAGTRQTAVTLKDLDWRLFIDDKQTVAGNLQSPLEIPGNGQTAVIPLGVSLDLYSFFAEKGYDGLVNLALALGGANGSAARLKLDAQPSITTPFGPMTYPSRITIVDKEFRGS